MKKNKSEPDAYMQEMARQERVRILKNVKLRKAREKIIKAARKCEDKREKFGEWSKIPEFIELVGAVRNLDRIEKED